MAKKKITPEIIEKIKEAKRYNKIAVVAEMFGMSAWTAQSYCRGIETILRPEVIESIISDNANNIPVNEIAAKYEVSIRKVNRIVGVKALVVDTEPDYNFPETGFFDYELCGPAFIQ